MKLNRILCPIDFSRFSVAANFYASLFAQEADAQVIFLSVHHPTSNQSPVEMQLQRLYTKLIDEIRPFVPDIRFTFEVRAGQPADEILKFADAESVDLIVMGTHGATGLERLLHGSVCRKVLRNAKCPVMAVKDSLNADWILPYRTKEATAVQK